ncbi:thioesterase family protein [Pseudonocardia spinosispora]|uniref:thioesterase family protein n=1 Tax=Pseudonocardia spinosispora TaxID=103441 RepID=UPI0004171AA0|nr:thioesterase family protein [Pseudonocardia spinosispora]
MTRSSLSVGTESPLGPTPFSAALELDEVGSGCYRAELNAAWEVGGGKQHGGLLLALVTKAGLAGLAAHTGADEVSEPLAVSGEFLRAPSTGTVEMTTEVLKVGRTASVVRSVLQQDGRSILAASVTAGRLPDVSDDASVLWTDLPPLGAEPPVEAIGTSEAKGPVPPLASACEVRIDPATSQYLRKERGEPIIRGWVRPRGEQPDPLFAILAGDILPPVLFNLGLPGWAPTVQLTAILRARPAPGWLRLQSSTMTIAGGWLDEDMAVIDSTGRLVCQARQLALAPLPRG